MTTLIADVETDGFLKDMTRIWTIQLGDADTEEVTVYADQPGFPPLAEAIERLKAADGYVFHNGMRFDLHAINKIYPGTIVPEKLWDTMVGGRLLFPQFRTHSLDAWGERLKCAKGSYGGDFSTFDEELVVYARQDIVVTRRLYRAILKKAEGWDWSKALWLEMLFQYVISLQEMNGFSLNIPLAVELQAEMRQELADLDISLRKIFPPRWVPKGGSAKKAYRPNKLKPTTWLGVRRRSDSPRIWEQYKGWGPTEFPFTAVELEEFNPSSRKQAADRLIKKYGWEPWKFTDGGSPAIDEGVLDELPYPEAKELLRYLTVEKQLGQIVNKQGDRGWLIYVNHETSRVHGAVNTLGTGTGRCTHFTPNMAQVNKKNLRMRECWVPREGWKLVGCDADGLEFACLAHYIAPLDGGTTIKRLKEGDKSKGTDVHSANRDALIRALKSTVRLPAVTKDVLKACREVAKTIVYALMYGSQDPGLGVSVSEMLTKMGVNDMPGNRQLGGLARRAIGEGIPGLNRLIDGVKRKAKTQGFIKGIDGRKIYVRSQHSAFNFLLQGAGAIAMKMALVIFHFEELPKTGWVHGVDFGYCANVHDEVQMEARPEIAQELGDLFARCITLAGERLGFRCQLTGSADVGNNWKETH